MIAKAEHTEKRANPRFIVTNIVGDPQKIYYQRYFARGEMENRVKGANDARRRLSERPPLVGELMEAASIGFGLHADGSAPAPGARRHRARPRPPARPSDSS